MDGTASTPISLMGIIRLTSFIPPTASTPYYCFRREQKREEYNRIIEALGYNSKQAPLDRQPPINKEFEKKDYILPVCFASIITALGEPVLLVGMMVIGPHLSVPTSGQPKAFIATSQHGAAFDFKQIALDKNRLQRARTALRHPDSQARHRQHHHYPCP